MTAIRFRHSRTALARLIVRWLPWPPSLLLAAWRWLAAEATCLVLSARTSPAAKMPGTLVSRMTLAFKPGRRGLPPP
jgi:hypothetical protein